jgi:periplasmic divalent cation tolerance protein
MQPVFLYMTAASAEEEALIGRTLVAERLVACANMLGPIRSFYWWDGAVQDGMEVALVAKTRADLAEAATNRVRSLHSYVCPCVVTLPLSGGNPEFLQWIDSETLGAPALAGSGPATNQETS